MSLVFLVVLHVSLWTVGTRGQFLFLGGLVRWLPSRTSRTRDRSWLFIIIGIGIAITLAEVIVRSVLIPVTLEVIVAIVVVWSIIVVIGLSFLRKCLFWRRSRT